jgi:hypothetical protein
MYLYACLNLVPMIKPQEYIDSITSELKVILADAQSTTKQQEKKLQEFFEKYPTALLPTLDGVEAQHSIFGSAVISQPRVKRNVSDFKPDFLIITWHSLGLFYNFIEIEASNKKFLRKDGEPTSSFTQAYNQLKHWKNNQFDAISEYVKFLKKHLFTDAFNWTEDKKISYNYILVYGFSKELKSAKEGKKDVVLSYFQGNERLCTYSRIQENIGYHGRPLFSVKWDYKSKKFQAIGVAPFNFYDPFYWSELHLVQNKDAVVQSSSIFDQDEKTKLIDKMAKLDSMSYSEILELNHTSEGSFSIQTFKDLDI